MPTSNTNTASTTTQQPVLQAACVREPAWLRTSATFLAEQILLLLHCLFSSAPLVAVL